MSGLLKSAFFERRARFGAGLLLTALAVFVPFEVAFVDLDVRERAGEADFPALFSFRLVDDRGLEVDFGLVDDPLGREFDVPVVFVRLLSEDDLAAGFGFAETFLAFGSSTFRLAGLFRVAVVFFIDCLESLVFEETVFAEDFLFSASIFEDVFLDVSFAEDLLLAFFGCVFDFLAEESFFRLDPDTALFWVLVIKLARRDRAAVIIVLSLTFTG